MRIYEHGIGWAWAVKSHRGEDTWELCNYVEPSKSQLERRGGRPSTGAIAVEVRLVPADIKTLPSGKTPAKGIDND